MASSQLYQCLVCAWVAFVLIAPIKESESVVLTLQDKDQWDWGSSFLMFQKTPIATNLGEDNDLKITPRMDRIQRKVWLRSGKIMNHQRRRLPVCESSSERFDPMTNSCFETGSRGPCGPLMVFVPNERHDPTDSTYGHCECDRKEGSLPMVSLRGKCYKLYTQAMCDPDQILMMEPTMFYGLHPVCVLNPCRKAGPFLESTPFVLFEGHCVSLNSPSTHCPHKDDVVTFRKDEMFPKCVTGKRNRRLFRRQITRTNELRCPRGYAKLKGGSRCYKLLTIGDRR